MKKLLIGFLLVAISAISFSADQYAYKLFNGKVGKFRVIQTEQAQAYISQGYSIADKQTMYGIMGDDFAKRVGVSAAEKFLWGKTVSKLMAQRAMRAMTDADGVYLEDKLLAFFAANPTAKRDWDASTEVNLDDPALQQALPLLGIDPAAVKQKMLDMGIAQ